MSLTPAADDPNLKTERQRKKDNPEAFASFDFTLTDEIRDLPRTGGLKPAKRVERRVGVRDRRRAR